MLFAKSRSVELLQTLIISQASRDHLAVPGAAAGAVGAEAEAALSCCLAYLSAALKRPLSLGGAA